MAAAAGGQLVLVGSRNPAKIAAAQSAVQRCFPALRLTVQGVESKSGVRDQPFGDDETLQGAINRVRSIQQQAAKQQPPLRWPDDALLVAVEGGVLQRGPADLYCFAWAAVTQAAAGRISTARSAEFLLPQELSRLVLGGMELGAADDAVFGRYESGRGTGTIGHLTRDFVTRAAYYESCLIMALVPLMHPSLYPGFHIECR